MPLSVAFGTAGPINAPREGEDAMYVRSVGEPGAAPPSGDSSTAQELQDVFWKVRLRKQHRGTGGWEKRSPGHIWKMRMERAGSLGSGALAE